MKKLLGIFAAVFVGAIGLASAGEISIAGNVQLFISTTIVVPPVAEGWVGSKNTNFGQGYGSAGQLETFSSYVATQTGIVSRIYIDRTGFTFLDMTIAVATIRDSNHVLLSSTTCTWVNIAGSIWEGSLASTITVTNGQTYFLGMAARDNDWNAWDNGDTGNIYRDSTSLGSAGSCPVGNVEGTIAEDETVATDGKLTMWASNHSGDGI